MVEEREGRGRGGERRLGEVALGNGGRVSIFVSYYCLLLQWSRLKA